MPELLTWHFAGLVFVGVFIGVFSVAVGGGLFVAIPMVETLFPTASVGAVVGNIKVGSFFRSIGSTAATWRQIEFSQNLKLLPAAMVGAVIGASTISHIDQRWLFPAIVSAIIFTVFAPKFAPRVTNQSFMVAAFVTGVYAGILGAGIGVMLVALLRLKHPQDAQLAFVKIQARFVEFLITTSAVITHLFNGNLIVALFLPLSIGGLVGGYIGGFLLHKMGELSGLWQKRILYAAFCVDLYVAGKKFFE